MNGLVIYGPNEGAFPDPFGDPVYNSIVDDCMGHTGGNADYHYHALLVACILRSVTVAEDEPDPVIGFALDGFPIYGPRGCADADVEGGGEAFLVAVPRGHPGGVARPAWGDRQHLVEPRERERGAQHQDHHDGRDAEDHHPVPPRGRRGPGPWWSGEHQGDRRRSATSASHQSPPAPPTPQAGSSPGQV